MVHKYIKSLIGMGLDLNAQLCGISVHLFQTTTALIR